jgi:ABC-type multidrug transport system fused ATPase/permease subunit
MNQLWESLKNNIGSILLGVCALVLLVGLGIAFVLLVKLVTSTPTQGVGPLPLLAIGGVVVLIMMLTVVAIIFKILGLTNQQQAMGLPEGSIRAVIALSLIVLFAILSVFLYQGVSTSGSVNTIANLSDTERTQFIRDHTTARDIQAKAVAVTDKDGQPLRNPDGTPKYLYNVSYSSANTTSDDFAKQLLVLLGTLMTAITSFYLGAGTATSAATAGQTAVLASPPPTVSGLKKTSYSVANDGPDIHLEVMGANLNIVTHVKIVRAGAQPVIGKNVGSSPTGVTCDIPVSAATTPPGAPWDVVVDDGGAKSATLPGAVTITA